MRKTGPVLLVLGAILVTGCAQRPLGPMVRVIPAPYKPFEVFQREQYDCERYADSQVAGDAQAANNRAVGAAAIGTALGLAVGAATGSGRGAATGAVAGGAIGTAIGANGSERENLSIQRRYDIAYSQCMYAKGNRVPGYGRRGPPPPPAYGTPPPPPAYGAPPPPPPGYRSAPPPDTQGAPRPLGPYDGDNG